MIYKTHIRISHCIEGDKEYYLVKGLEYPNLITEGESFDNAIEMAIDAWTLLCTVYEDNNADIQLPNSDIEVVNNEDEKTVLIESLDTIEYRKDIEWETVL